MGLFRNGKPIIMKESGNAKRQLAELEALRGTLSPTKEMELEADIRAVKAGITGEDRILFELRNSHMDMIVLQDLFLEHDGLTAQIDFLVLTRQRFFVLECKNLYGNIEINERGDFIRTFGGRKREGIYSPVAQNQRHLKLIRAMRRDNRSTLVNLVFDRDFYDYYRSLIVLANPKTVLDDSKAPQKIRNLIVRSDQLINRIESLNAERGPGREKSFMSAIQSSAEWFMEQDRNAGGSSFAEKYRDEEIARCERAMDTAAKVYGPRTNISHVESTTTRDLTSMSLLTTDDSVRCPRCGSAMVLRTAKRGEHAGQQFYGCSRFPKCRGIITIESKLSQ